MDKMKELVDYVIEHGSNYSSVWKHIQELALVAKQKHMSQSDNVIDAAYEAKVFYKAREASIDFAIYLPKYNDDFCPVNKMGIRNDVIAYIQDLGIEPLFVYRWVRFFADMCKVQPNHEELTEFEKAAKYIFNNRDVEVNRTRRWWQSFVGRTNPNWRNTVDKYVKSRALSQNKTEDEVKSNIISEYSDRIYSSYNANTADEKAYVALCLQRSIADSRSEVYVPVEIPDIVKVGGILGNEKRTAVIMYITTNISKAVDKIDTNVDNLVELGKKAEIRMSSSSYLSEPTKWDYAFAGLQAIKQSELKYVSVKVSGSDIDEKEWAEEAYKYYGKDAETIAKYPYKALELTPIAKLLHSKAISPLAQLGVAALWKDKFGYTAQGEERDKLDSTGWYELTSYEQQSILNNKAESDGRNMSTSGLSIFGTITRLAKLCPDATAKEYNARTTAKRAVLAVAIQDGDSIYLKSAKETAEESNPTLYDLGRPISITRQSLEKYKILRTYLYGNGTHTYEEVTKYINTKAIEGGMGISVDSLLNDDIVSTAYMVFLDEHPELATLLNTIKL